MKQTQASDSPTFGIIICASPYDWLFAKATIASIRYNYPAIPITLLIDGKVDVGDTLTHYSNISLLDRSSIDDRWLRNNSFGWGITKMLAFYYSPYDYFLYLDSDTVIWGDVLSKLTLFECDIITDLSSDAESISDSDVDTWFFDVLKIQAIYPDFPLRKYAKHFWCTGTFVSKKGIIPLDMYKEMYSLQAKDPHLFFPGEMGFLNLSVFLLKHRNKLTQYSCDFQTIFADYTLSQLYDLFPFKHGSPQLTRTKPTVIHIPDQKPLLSNPKAYSLPFTYYRLMYLQQVYGIRGSDAYNTLYREDCLYISMKRRSRIHRYIRRVNTRIKHRLHLR